MRVAAYCDASYGVYMDGKSHSGTFITVGRGPIMAKSVTQKIVTKSSTEAELVTVSDVTSAIAYVLHFSDTLGIEF